MPQSSIDATVIGAINSQLAAIEGEAQAVDALLEPHVNSLEAQLQSHQQVVGVQSCVSHQMIKRRHFEGEKDPIFELSSPPNSYCTDSNNVATATLSLVAVAVAKGQCSKLNLHVRLVLLGLN